MNKQNEKDVESFLSYLTRIKQVCKETKTVYNNYFNHLIAWSNRNTIPDMQNSDEALPDYLRRQLGKYTKRPLSPTFITETLKTIRMFLYWARREFPERYKITDEWIESFKPGRSSAEDSVLVERKLYTLDEITKLINVSVNTMRFQRHQAAIALMFMSGIRIGAFITLPIKAVDLNALTIKQLPSLGVHTKFNIAAITSIIPIPELMDVAIKWDSFVRNELPDNYYWYSMITSRGKLSPHQRAGDPMNSIMDFRKILGKLCALADVEYKNPHSLRHGHAVYAIKRVKNMEQYKAVSQNLMHSNIQITDAIYSQLARDDVHKAITSLV